MKGANIKKYLSIALIFLGVFALLIAFYFALDRYDQVSAAISKIIEILHPFIFGAVLAYILKPACNTFENIINKLFSWINKKRRQKNSIAAPISEKLTASISKYGAILISLALAFLIIYLLLNMIIPQLINSIRSLFESIPGYVNSLLTSAETLVRDNKELMAWLDELSMSDFIKNLNFETIAGYVKNFFNFNILSGAQGIMDGVGVGISAVIGFVKTVFIGIIVSVYLLAQRKKLAAQSKMIVHSVFKNNWPDMIIDEFRFIDRTFSSFINGKLLDSAVVAVLLFITLRIFNVPYAMLVSVIMGVFNVIPFFGPWIGAVPSTLLILIVDPIKALYFVIIVLIIMQIDGNILEPRIVGNKTGLSGLWVLFAIIVFGGMFGFLGMIMGVPAFAVIYDLVTKLVNKTLTEKGKSEMLTEYENKYHYDDNNPKRKFRIRLKKLHKDN